MIKCEELVRQAERLLDTPYSQIDCQAFVEQAMALCGEHHDWKGSNHMYRDVRGLTRVEFFKDFYGDVPPGCALFIWDNGGGEVQRGYTDGLGNASHVGLTTGKLGEKGAIHSSQSKGKVCYSKFEGKPINGGWSYIGFFKNVDYGEKIEKMLSEDEHEEERILLNATVIAAKGKTVNMRSEPDKNKRVIMTVPVGATVLVVETAGEDWYMIEYKGKQGFMMAEFLQLEEDPYADEEEETTPVPDDRLADIERRLKRLEDEWADKMGWG